jgi:hypothetical protein
LANSVTKINKKDKKKKKLKKKKKERASYGLPLCVRK